MMQSDSSWRYQAPEQAQRYGQRKQKRMQREAALLCRILTGLSLEGSLLDVPCGTGRLAEALAIPTEQYLGCDAALGMLGEARGRGLKVVQGRLPDLPFADRSVPNVICFRLLHHVPTREQESFLYELARITGRYLLVTGFHPFSAHEWQRRLRLALRRKPRGRFTTEPRWVAELLATQGLQQLRVQREGFFRDLWLGLYERQQSRRRERP
ncbi:MAG: hypothetical protein CSA62_11290 [Planctomycetota bacterium]|nr:MAG: hypothetical protein CSA62_11290 [Planctomycetota bacterium]